MEKNKKFCKFCGKEIEKDSIICPKCGRQLKEIKEKEENKIEEKKKEPKKYDESNKFYAQSWFMWVMLIFFAPVGIFLMWEFDKKMKKNTKIILTIIFSLFFIIILLNSDNNGTTSSSSGTYSSNTSSSTTNSKKKVEIINFTNMKEHEILTWCKEKNITCNFKREYSNTIAKDAYIKQSVNAGEKINEGSTITVTYSLGKEPTTEQKNALKKAQIYSETMHMSKKGIYDQLTSEYGEGFDKESATYAINNVEADWKENALKKAKTYRDTMSMSKSAIYEQLISEYGEQFTKEEAQYAIDHLED